MKPPFVHIIYHRFGSYRSEREISITSVLSQTGPGNMLITGQGVRQVIIWSRSNTTK